jgi:hypothetical protein
MEGRCEKTLKEKALIGQKRSVRTAQLKKKANREMECIVKS